MRRTVGLVLAVLAGPGCFFYDSRWGQEKQVQRHNAEAMAPAALTASPSSSSTATNAKPFKVRVRATPAYVSQTVDWKHDTRGLVEEANQVLGPTLGARLEIVSLDTWTPKSGKDDLAPAMNDLAADDPGEGADWVIGLIGGLPTYAPSFEQIGLGEVLGKHILLRSAIDLGEHDAIEGNLGELSPDDRARLVRERKRHRAITALLHEIGHTLGAVHEDDKTLIMHPAYSPKMRGYGKTSPVLLRIGIARHADVDKRTVMTEVLAYYKGTADSWLAPERSSFIANLEKSLGPAPAPAKPVEKPKADVSALSEKDRPLYEKSVELQAQGKSQDAWNVGKPLFTTYPKVFAVQDLRCQLAMKLSTDLGVVREECKLLMDLSTTKP